MNVLDRFRLDGRVAVVTGGGRGLGAAAACALAEAGAHLVLLGRTTEPLEATVDKITEAGGTAQAARLDVSDDAAVRSTFADLAASLGRLDVLVNNAGLAHQAPVLEVGADDWDLVVNANLRGTFMCAQAFARIPSDGDRSIVNVASLVAHVGVRNQAAYVASKGGVVSLTRALALELARERIRVNAISPGYFRTDMPAEVLDDPAATEALLRRVPQRRIGEPEEFGPAVLFLASPASTFMTGAVLNIDGGYIAQ